MTRPTCPDCRRRTRRQRAAVLKAGRTITDARRAASARNLNAARSRRWPRPKLEAWQRKALRRAGAKGRAILAYLEGKPAELAADPVGVRPETVRRWATAFLAN